MSPVGESSSIYLERVYDGVYEGNKDLVEQLIESRLASPDTDGDGEAQMQKEIDENRKFIFDT